MVLCSFVTEAVSNIILIYPIAWEDQSSTLWIGSFLHRQVMPRVFVVSFIKLEQAKLIKCFNVTEQEREMKQSFAQ